MFIRDDAVIQCSEMGFYQTVYTQDGRQEFEFPNRAGWRISLNKSTLNRTIQFRNTGSAIH